MTNPSEPIARPSSDRILTITLGAVAFALALQTLQLSGRPAAPTAAATTPPASAAAAPLPSSVQNLPNMVGGC